MTDRASRCISHAFEFLKDVEYCSTCRLSILGPEDCSLALGNGSSLVKSSVSTSDLAQTEDSTPRHIHVCMCPDRKSVPLSKLMDTVQENHITKDGPQVVNGSHYGNVGDDGVMGESESSTNPDTVTSCHSTKSAAAVGACQSARAGETGGSGMGCVDAADRAANEPRQSGPAEGTRAVAEKDTVQLRRKSDAVKQRSVTTVVREAFEFLDTMDEPSDDNGGNDEKSDVKAKEGREMSEVFVDGGESARHSAATTASISSISSFSTIISTTSTDSADISTATTISADSTVISNTTTISADSTVISNTTTISADLTVILTTATSSADSTVISNTTTISADSTVISTTATSSANSAVVSTISADSADIAATTISANSADMSNTTNASVDSTALSHSSSCRVHMKKPSLSLDATVTESSDTLENGYADEVGKEANGERDKKEEEADREKNGVKEREEEDNTDVLLRRSTASTGVVMRRPRVSRQASVTEPEEGDSDDSSDEDCKVYNPTFRNSTWMKLGEEEDSVSECGVSLVSQDSQDQAAMQVEREKEETKRVKEEEADKAGREEETATKSSPDPDQLRVPKFSRSVSNTSTADEVFEWPMTAGTQAGHKRSDSTSTTLSEVEFKRVYTSRSKCMVQRNDSQQEYHRLSAKFYDQEQVAVLEREEGEADYGLHIIDSHPAIITTIQPGRAADRAGVKEGQILISINGISVLESSHEEIVTLFQQLTGAVKLEVGNSDVVPLRDMQMPVMSGYLCKLGTATLVKMWKKRYFVLRNDHCLYYYKNEQEKMPLGAIPLSGYSISRFVDTNRDYCFKAEKYGARTYYFMAENRDDMTRWAGAMTEAAAKSKVKKSSWLEVSSHNVGLPALEIRRPECSGFLAKLGGTHRVWRRRYCVLKDACLYYFKSLNSLHAQGVVHFHGYKVDGCGVGSKKHGFSLIPPDSSLRTFHFTAENETDKRRWVEALIRSIQRWVEVKDE